ncbi:MAG: DUF5908 family protein [Rhodospirillales bacterium]|jgi:hypothetical protein|nr:DUF5908 family protein [Rhodospirillales bacterium]
MPIEIKELVIRAVVDPAPDSDPPAAAAPDRAAIIEACVEETLRILRRAKER